MYNLLLLIVWNIIIINLIEELLLPKCKAATNAKKKVN